jgi:hypothetical protein
MSIINVAPKHTFSFSDTSLNVFHANIGEGLPRHEHDFNHLTYCVNGSCAIRKEGKEVVITKESQPINLGGKEWHEIEALEDGTVIINIFKRLETYAY